MGKYSRKVKTWGALPEHTAHRNKQGKVTSRTRYHNGKAITTRVPKEPAYTKPGYRGAGFSLGDTGGTVLTVGIIVILLAAGIGWVANLVGGALVGFWPIAGSIIAWAAAAAWAISLVMAVLSAVSRFTYNGPDFGSFAATIGQGFLFALSFFSAVALVMNPVPMDSPAELWWSNAGIVAALGTSIAVALSAIVLCFVSGFRWLFLLLGMALTFFVFMFFAPNAALCLPAVVGTVFISFKFNRDEVFG